MDAITLSVWLRGAGTLAAVIGATVLAFHGKEGWGWMIFLAIVLGSYSVKLD